CRRPHAAAQSRLAAPAVQRPQLQPAESAAKHRAGMGKKLFVGNLSYGVTENELRELFSQAGTCESASIVTDRDTGQSRGFAVVMMASAEDAERAKRQLNGTDVQGRRLRVDDANDQSAGRSGGGSRGGPRPGGRRPTSDRR